MTDMNNMMAIVGLARRVLLVLFALFLSGCVALGPGKTGVLLTAVNYTDEDYDVVGIARADDPEQLEAMGGWRPMRVAAPCAACPCRRNGVRG